MNKKKLSIFVIFLMIFSALPLQASITLYLKLRFFEGIREGAEEPPKFVTSSHLQSTVSASIRSKFILAEEKEQIKKVFNLREVELITEADLSWNSKGSKNISHLFRLDSKIYRILITPSERDRMHQFKIEVFEQDKTGENSLLDTEIILPEENIAVFGFEDKQGKPYFLSFHIPKRVDVGVDVGEIGGIVGGVVPGERDKDFAKDAVRAVGEIKPPKLIKLVKPVYPEEARREGVEGVVIVEARTDKEGNVEAVQVLRGIDPHLNKAAMAAVLQWKYEPMYIKGKPNGVVFTVTVRFKLKDKDKEIGDFAKGAIELGEDEKPRLVKEVKPVYPEELRKAGIQGVVTLRIRTDEQGRVAKVRVLTSESSLLNKPAIDAVRQWIYEVYYSKEKPKPVVFPVKITFKLR